jgi:hypothetical protein
MFIFFLTVGTIYLYRITVSHKPLNEGTRVLLDLESGMLCVFPLSEALNGLFSPNPLRTLCKPTPKRMDDPEAFRLLLLFHLRKICQAGVSSSGRSSSSAGVGSAGVSGVGSSM